MCGLAYQVLWLRLLSLIFGITVYAASTVLGAFMAGLAIGSALAGRVIARMRRPLLIFGIAEILIGLSAGDADRSMPRLRSMRDSIR